MIPILGAVDEGPPLSIGGVFRVGLGRPARTADIKKRYKCNSWAIEVVVGLPGAESVQRRS